VWPYWIWSTETGGEGTEGSRSLWERGKTAQGGWSTQRQVAAGEDGAASQSRRREGHPVRNPGEGEQAPGTEDRPRIPAACKYSPHSYSE